VRGTESGTPSGAADRNGNESESRAGGRGSDDGLVSVGEALIALLERAGIDTVFGIPGIHTIELYRALAASGIRHVTPRHEQGAAFMADGYARVSGKPGVCFLITGPGLSNAVTAMAQARSERVPMLLVSGVNPRDTLGEREEGRLHELPDQGALAAAVALRTDTLRDPERLVDVLTESLAALRGPRPGPVHLEIPIDVMSAPLSLDGIRAFGHRSPRSVSRVAPSSSDIERAATLCRTARRVTILAGGGTVRSAGAVRALAERLDAPVISTTNARGIMAAHPLDVPASPSLAAVRELVARSDLVLALGTEMGATDYDLYERGPLPLPEHWIRVDTDPATFAREPFASLAIRGEAGAFAEALVAALTDETTPSDPTAASGTDEAGDAGGVFDGSGGGAGGDGTAGDGAGRARAVRERALAELGEEYRALLDTVGAIWRALPGATLVGDSTQPIYAGNLYVDAPHPGAWFNSATGYGTLGYAPPAAIGAAIGDPDRSVVCLVGDGGLQFSLAELGSARDIDADVAFVVWNSHGYLEIERAMTTAGVVPLGVTPSAPDFVAVAKAYGLPARRVRDSAALEDALASLPRPCLVEYEITSND